jgi:hypothetical protein
MAAIVAGASGLHKKQRRTKRTGNAPGHGTSVGTFDHNFGFCQ